MGPKLTPAEAADAAEAYVSAFTVREQTDGIGPFDADDEPGNDSSDDNRVVRSFDSVSYLLEYTTELSNKTHPVTGPVTLKTEFVLPMDPSKARFDEQTLNWAENASVTYIYADGSESTTWDKSKTVTQQVYRADRILRGQGADDRVPGAGQLSVGIKIYAAVEGDTVEPEFRLHVENDSRTVTCMPELVEVSSYPRLNIRLTRYASSMNRQGYFDFSDGSINRTDAEGRINGRHEGYGLSLRIQNTTVDKGLKGLELPTGDITFDLRMSTGISHDGAAEEDVSDDVDWAPLFWDYKENRAAGLNAKGKYERNMAPYEATQSYLTWTEFYNAGNNANGAYNGGTWTITQDAADDDLYHIRISGYKFDLDDFSFPYTYPGNPTGHIDATANIGTFSVGYLQFIAQYPREVDGTYNLYLRAHVENLHAASATQSSITEQCATGDDDSSFTVPLYAPGTIDKYVDFVSIPGGKTGNNPTWNQGDGYGAQGAKSRVCSILTYTGDEPITSWNALLKFDDELLYLPAANEFAITNSTSTVGSIAGDLNVLFAAKPDGTSWVDQTEMNQTPEEGLIYFNSLEELEATGRTCVGILTEVRNCNVYGGRDQAAAVTNITCFIRPDAEAGQVAAIVNDLRAWKGDEQPMRWSDFMQNADGSYGTGDAGTMHKQYIDGYLTPYVDIWRNYVPSKYANGTMVGGHTGGVRYGDSCLIVGAKNGVRITVADMVGDRSKTTYDLDANERTVTYKVQPTLSVASANGETQDVGLKTDMTVQVDLPVGLTYDAMSASIDPDSIVENDDGTSTVTWILHDVEVGAVIEPITLTCTIGYAGTDHDVVNNQQLIAQATVYSDLDQRKINSANGNLSKTSIVCIRLAAISVFKQVTPVHANPDDAHTWTLRFGNSSETDVTNAGLVDTMPWSGDARGSRFSGTYRVMSITLDLSSAPQLLDDHEDALDELLWCTADESARTIGDDAMLMSAANIPGRQLVGAPQVTGTKLTWNVNRDLADFIAWGLDIGTMHGQEYLQITINVEPTGSVSGDVYANSFTENAQGQAAIVHSNVVKTDVEDVSFEVRKVWNGVNGFTGTPEVIAVVVGSDGSEMTLKLNETNGFMNRANNLDRYEANGSRITYTVEERDVPDGYILQGITGSDTAGFGITNKALTGMTGLTKSAREFGWS